MSFELAAQYRRHAKAIRAAAEFHRTDSTSESLYAIASEYERMAAQAEAVTLARPRSRPLRGAASEPFCSPALALKGKDAGEIDDESSTDTGS